MFRALSIAPPPKPKGIPQRIKTNGDFENEEHNNAIAVKKVETITTLLVPNFSIIFALSKLDISVKQEIGVEISQAEDSLIPKVSEIAGQAEPNSESGTPSPIYAVKIIINNKVAMSKIIDLLTCFYANKSIIIKNIRRSNAPPLIV